MLLIYSGTSPSELRPPSENRSPESVSNDTVCTKFRNETISGLMKGLRLHLMVRRVELPGANVQGFSSQHYKQ